MILFLHHRSIINQMAWIVINRIEKWEFRDHITWNLDSKGDFPHRVIAREKHGCVEAGKAYCSWRDIRSLISIWRLFSYVQKTLLTYRTQQMRNTVWLYKKHYVLYLCMLLLMTVCSSIPLDFYYLSLCFKLQLAG